MILLLATVLLSAFRVQEKIDAITDTRSVYAVIGDQHASIAMGCRAEGNRKSAFATINLGQYVGDARRGILAGGRELTYRFDHRAPETDNWSSSQNQLFTEEGTSSAILLMIKFRNSSSVAIRTYDFEGKPIDLSFDYPDATSLIEGVMARCGFNIDGTKLRHP